MDFNQALKVDPKNARTIFMLGVAYNLSGESRRAMGTFERALSIDPKQIDARREYAVVLAQLGRADQARAQFEILKKAQAAALQDGYTTRPTTSRTPSSGLSSSVPDSRNRPPDAAGGYYGAASWTLKRSSSVFGSAHFGSSSDAF